MAIKIRKVTKNDLQPYYYVQIKNSTGAAVDLTSASIVCSMRLPGSTTSKIDRQSTGINITDPTNGKFEYRWQPGDTDTPGLYDIEFEVTPSGAGKMTFPNDETQGPAQVRISDSLDSV